MAQGHLLYENYVQLKQVFYQRYLSEQATLNSLLNRDLSIAVSLVDELPMPDTDFDINSSYLEMHPELLKYDKLYARTRRYKKTASALVW